MSSKNGRLGIFKKDLFSKSRAERGSPINGNALQGCALETLLFKRAAR
jgi:hypothetical protein